MRKAFWYSAVAIMAFAGATYGTAHYALRQPTSVVGRLLGISNYVILELPTVNTGACIVAGMSDVGNGDGRCCLSGGCPAMEPSASDPTQQDAVVIVEEKAMIESLSAVRENKRDTHKSTIIAWRAFGWSIDPSGDWCFRGGSILSFDDAEPSSCPEPIWPECGELCYRAPAVMPYIGDDSEACDPGYDNFHYYSTPRSDAELRQLRADWRLVWMTDEYSQRITPSDCKENPANELPYPSVNPPADAKSSSSYHPSQWLPKKPSKTDEHCEPKSKSAADIEALFRIRSKLDTMEYRSTDASPIENRGKTPY
jgi:hypothetical protein